MLTVLAARGIAVPEDRRAAILACTDLAVLDDWVTRAATATSVEDLADGA